MRHGGDHDRGPALRRLHHRPGRRQPGRGRPRRRRARRAGDAGHRGRGRLLGDGGPVAGRGPRGPRPAPAGGRSGVRYFSPLAEVAFCGHATIASAVALAHRDGPGELLLDTPAGEIAVRTEQREVVLASLVSVPTRTRPITDGELSPLLAALRWSPGDLDPDWPVHVAN